MTQETMNIHKALSELKILDDRIAKAIRDCKFVGVTKRIAQMIGSEKVEDFKNTEKAKYQSAEMLIWRRNAIKRAVVLSNAKTEVVIGYKTYTVAEAIEMKNHGMDGKRQLLEKMTFALMEAERKIELTTASNDGKADQYVASIFTGKDVRGEEAKAVREAYLSGLAVELVDPLDIRKKIKELEEEIAAFTTEVDAALATSNANTNIVIEV